MGTFDTITWQALTAVLTLAGLVGTVAFWRARGPVAGLRTLALALLPAAAYLTGTIRLLWQVGDAVASWALHLTFSPAVWLGIGLAAVSLLLFSLAGALRRRQPVPSRRRREETLPGGDASGRSGTASTKAIGRGAPGTPARGRGQAAADEDDLSDIEAILKKHGIT